MIRYLTLYFAMFWMMSVPAHANVQRDPNAEAILDIQEVTSPQHGIQAWLVEDHSLPLFSMHFAFKGAGTAQDPHDKQGLVRLLSNTLDEGAGDLDSQAFQKALDDRSITLRYSASRDHVSGELKTLSRYEDKAFDLLRLSLTQPRFDAEPLARMITANQARLKSSLANPRWRAARLMNEAAFKGHPYAQNSGGTLSSLATITADDLRSYHAKSFARDNLIVAVSGAITPEALGQRLDEIFADLPATADLKLIQGVSFDFDNALWHHPYDIPQTVILRLQKGLSIHNEDYFKGVMLNQILGASGFGSRLMESIREEAGLTYGIYSGLDHYERADLLTISTSTKNENAAEMLDKIEAELRNFEASPITPPELGSARRYLLGQLPLGLTSHYAVAATLLSLQSDGLPLDYLDKRQDAISAMGLYEMNAFATRFFSDLSHRTILVGKPEGLQSKDAQPILTIESLPHVE